MRFSFFVLVGSACALSSFADAAASKGAGAADDNASVASCDIANTVRVKGTGRGVTKEKALKDAYRDAVEHAVGLYVDTEQLLDNDKLVKDKVLTHSNAYIEKYEEKNLANNDGLLEIEIVAWVRRRELTQKLREVMPTMTVNVSKINQSLYAEIVTKDKRDGDAEALLKDVFDEFDPLAQLMKVSPVNEKAEVSPSKESADTKILSYQLRFQVDPDKYFKVWAPHMDKILSQISLAPGKPFNFKRVKSLSDVWKDKIALEYYSEKSRDEYFAYNKMYFMAAYLLDADRFIFGQSCATGNYGFGGEMSFRIGVALERGDPYYDLWNSGSRQRCVRRWGMAPEMKAKSKYYVALVKRANQGGCSGMFYELSDRSAAAISAWMSKYSGLSDERMFDNRSARSTVYHAFLKDASGDEIASGECRAFNHDMSNVGCICWSSDRLEDERNKPGNTIPYVIYMTPWVGCFAGECSTWINVEVDKEDVAKIATISVSAEER